MTLNLNTLILDLDLALATPALALGLVLAQVTLAILETLGALALAPCLSQHPELQ